MKVNNNFSSIYNNKGTSVKYTFKPARKDCNHLVVLFNGYRQNGWDFQNSMGFIKCHLLLIEDSHYGKQSYYLGDNQSFSFADSIDLLIRQTLDKLDLDKSHCTLWGLLRGDLLLYILG